MFVTSRSGLPVSMGTGGATYGPRTTRWITALPVPLTRSPHRRPVASAGTRTRVYWRAGIIAWPMRSPASFSQNATSITSSPTPTSRWSCSSVPRTASATGRIRGLVQYWCRPVSMVELTRAPPSSQTTLSWSNVAMPSRMRPRSSTSGSSSGSSISRASAWARIAARDSPGSSSSVAACSRTSVGASAPPATYSTGPTARPGTRSWASRRATPPGAAKTSPPSRNSERAGRRPSLRAQALPARRRCATPSTTAMCSSCPAASTSAHRRVRTRSSR